eukprot:TRINITY_DN462_c0_g1_i1.p1 TRINITY_DN462_c0_g1~~TRINITY_DN462_c0_g1_i1.p1  ORF type:complete len:199 (-),score=23.27 TRINITY_DN462_c0_g1_i1:87-683(-)
MASTSILSAIGVTTPSFMNGHSHDTTPWKQNRCVMLKRRLKHYVVSQYSHTGPSELACSCSFSRRTFLGFTFLTYDALADQGNLSRGQEGQTSCELKFAPTGLGYCDTLLGTGVQASEGQLIKAHYIGKLEDGKVFDSSYSRGKPLTFRVGVGEVIKGWDQGILGGPGISPMLAGGKRTLKIPPELGYGARGAGCRGD